jgi:hypothetical protein
MRLKERYWESHDVESEDEPSDNYLGGIALLVVMRRRSNPRTAVTIASTLAEPSDTLAGEMEDVTRHMSPSPFSSTLPPSVSVSAVSPPATSSAAPSPS